MQVEGTQVESMQIEGMQVEGGDEGAWQVQNSSKHRSLKPQFTVTKADLGADSPRNKAVSLSEKPPALTKQVLRYTKEQILNIRGQTKVLSIMEVLTDITSTDCLDPVCNEPLTVDDVYRLWNAGNIANNKNVVNKSKGAKTDEVEADDQWMRGSHVKAGTDEWNGDKGFDLSDFAAAAEKFRSETKDLGLGSFAIVSNDDALNRLIADEADELMAAEKLDEEDASPEWDVGDTSDSGNNANNDNSGTETKRNLLLETLHGKADTSAAAVKANEEKLNKLQLNAESSFSSNSLGNAKNMVDSLRSMFASTPLNVGVGGTVFPVQQTVVQAPILHAIPSPAYISTPIQWLYLDPNSKVQGPFENDAMKKWCDAGYFKLDLPIKLPSWQSFHLLGRIFPTIEVAFDRRQSLSPTEPVSTSTLDAGGRNPEVNNKNIYNLYQQQQQQHQHPQNHPTAYSKQQVLEQQHAQEQQRLLEQRRVQEQQHLQEQQRQQELQFSMYTIEHQRLEQQRLDNQRVTQQKAKVKQESDAKRKEQEKKEPGNPWGNTATKPTSVELSKLSLAQIQAEELRKANEAREKGKIDMSKPVWGNTPQSSVPSLEQIQQAESVLTKQNQLKSLLGMSTGSSPVKSGATGAASNLGWTLNQSDKVSLRDIMQEESSSSSHQTKGNANSWAALAGASQASIGLSSGAAPSQPVKQLPKSLEKKAPVLSPSVATEASSPRIAATPKVSNPTTDLFDWAVIQLNKIKPNSNMNDLIQYCITLESAVELRETFGLYLGSTPQVSSFASEFIRRKETLSFTNVGAGTSNDSKTKGKKK